MKIGRIITNRRVKLRVWLGNARHHPWLRNSSQLSSSTIKLTQLRDKKGAVLVHFTPKSETVNSQKYCDVLQTNWSPRSNNWRGAKLVKDATNFFLTELRNMWNAGTGTLKSKEIALKSNISFVSIFTSMCFFLKSRYFLTYPHTYVSYF
jgi:hypothetical protein